MHGSIRRNGMAMVSVALAALTTLTLVGPRPVFAARPVRGLVTKPLSPAPDGANAIRYSIYGDKSGARVQVRLLATGQDGVLTGYFAAPPLTLDFEGWKTVVVPFTDFVYESETNPETTQDGIGSKDTLGQSATAQFAVTAENAKIYLADMGWSTAGAAPTDPLLAPIDLTSDGDNVRARAAGDNTQIRALTLAVNTEPAFNKDGKPSLRVIVRNPAINEKGQNTAAVAARLKAQAQLPYTLYTRPVFEAVEPESTPTLAEAKAGANLVVTACADDIEPTTFVAYSIKDLASVTVKVSGNLSNAAGQTLPANALDVRIVRSAPVYNGPQLLVKDDHAALSTSSDITLTGDPTTSLTAGVSKQFWVTVRVPKNQAPGTYKGVLTFSATGVKATAIPLTVEVQNLPLKSSALLYAMELRSLLSAGEPIPGASVVTPDQLTAQLINIREHGFTIALLHESGPDLEAEMKAYKAAELRPSGLVVVSQAPDAGTVGQVDTVRQSLSTAALPFTVYYYLTPSLISGGAADYVKSVKDTDRNALVVAPVDSSATYSSLSTALDDAEGSKLSPIYPVSSDYAQKVLKDRKRSTTNKDFWTWSVANQNPVKNRLLAGYMTFKTGTTQPGFYGVFLGPYQNIPDGTDPYAAFGEGAANAAILPQQIAYPVKNGTLDTLQWEAIREGIDDTRYMGVLKTYIRQIKDNDALRIRYKAVTDNSELLLANQLERASLTMTAEQAQNYRALVIKECIKLRDLLNPPAAPKPVPAKPTPAKPTPGKPAAKPAPKSGKKP